MKVDMVFDLGENKGNLYMTEDEARELWGKLNSFFGHTPQYYYSTHPWITTGNMPIPYIINTTSGTYQ
jgi:hypothetical protein